ncbi:MAG: hypothetical protein HFJ20_03105 [Clostridia bacterium]|nr:hypothetical protein [Clostridia bacterium]
MADKSSVKTKESTKQNKNNGYSVEFGIFQQIEKYNEKLGTNINVMNLPPKNSREYKGLMDAIQEQYMEIKAMDYNKVIGKDGKLLARVDSKTGKVLTGKVPTKSKKKNIEQEM